jgi:hypothetical protein
MFRFSRNKRFAPYTYGEFHQMATDLARLVHDAHPNRTYEVLACQEPGTYEYSTVTFWDERVIDALKIRKSFSLHTFTREEWNRSLKVEIYLKDASQKAPFMVTMTLDCVADPKHMYFYGQEVVASLESSVRQHFARPGIFHSIGNGYQPVSHFNLKFGENLMKKRA